MFLNCDRVKCEKTCDTKGADEIYFIAVANRSDKQVFSYKTAVPLKIDEPDEDSPNIIDNTMIIEFPMNPGDSASIMVSLMSSDGTNVAEILADIVAAAGPALVTAGEVDSAKYATALFDVLKKLSKYTADADDLIGLFRVQVTCIAAGRYTWDFKPVQNCNNTVESGYRYFKMNGDGGIYHTWFSIQ